LRCNPKPRHWRVGKKRRSLQKVEGYWGGLFDPKTGPRIISIRGNWVRQKGENVNHRDRSCCLFSIVSPELLLRAHAVADRDHAPPFIGVEEAAVGGASTLIPDQRLIGPGAVHIAAEHGVAHRRPLRDQCAPRIVKVRGNAALINRAQPPRRVVRQGH
jgi:hypothetical protein